MKAPEPSRLLDLLAALSQQTNLSVGCYCEDEARCHRSVLRELLNADSESVRLSAARSILDHTVRLSEFAHVEQRLSNLESALQASEKKK